MIQILYRLILAFFTIIILKNYIDNIYQEKRKLKKCISIIIWILYYGYAFVLEMYTFNPVIVLLLNLMLVFIVTSILTKENIKKKILFSILLYSVWMFIEIIVNYSFIAFYSFNDSKIAGSFLSKIITLFILRIIIMHFKVKEDTYDFNIKIWKLMLLAIGNIIIAYTIFRLNKYSDSVMGVLSYFSLVFLLVVTLLIFKLYAEIVDQYQDKLKNFYYEQQIERYSKEVKRIQQENMEIRQVKHNIKNHFAYMSYLLNAEKYPECLDFINRIQRTHKVYNRHAYCGNVIFNAMLNNVFDEINKESIVFVHKINIPDQLYFEDVHLCILLGNVLDNALEALREIDHGMRRLYLYAQYSKGVLVIGVKNNYKSKIVTNGGRIISRKQNAILHGIGLESVRKIAKIYNGIVDIDYSKNIFSISIILYERENLRQEWENSTSSDKKSKV